MDVVFNNGIGRIQDFVAGDPDTEYLGDGVAWRQAIEAQDGVWRVIDEWPNQHAGNRLRDAQIVTFYYGIAPANVDYERWIQDRMRDLEQYAGQ